MAKVPYTPYNQATPGPPPDLRAGATPAAFGVGVTSAISGLGNAVSGLGDTYAKAALAQQQLNNELWAKDADNQFAVERSDILFNPEQGYFQSKGKAAIEGYKPTQEMLLKLRDKYANSAPNDVAKKLFLASAQRHIDYSYQGMGRHAISENNRYARETVSARITNLSNEGAQYWNDDAHFSKVESAVANETDALGRVSGWDKDTVESQKTTNVSNLWKHRIARAADDDLDAATKMYEKNKGKMSAGDLANVEAILQNGRLRKGSEANLKAKELEGKIASDVESIEKTGIGVAGMDEKVIKNTLGGEAVTRYRDAKSAAYKVHNVTQDIYSATPEQMNRRLLNMEPSQGSPTFEREAKIYNYVRDKFNTMLELRKTDPAQAVADDPQVKEYSKNGDFPMMVEARIAAQTAAGIPPAAQSPMTLQEVEKYSAPLIRTLPGKERDALNQVAESLKKDFGGRWEQAFTYMIKSMKVNAKTAEMATHVVRNLVNGAVVPPNQLQQESEAAAAQKAQENFTIDSVTGEVIPTPVPNVPPPEKKRPLSQRILEGR